ncbi:hypothetical protein [Variovorax boronicumulans]
MIRRTKKFRTAVNLAGDVAIWLCLAILAGLATDALMAHRAREAERLERVHLDGMVAGNALCTKGQP